MTTQSAIDRTRDAAGRTVDRAGREVRGELETLASQVEKLAAEIARLGKSGARSARAGAHQGYGVLSATGEDLVESIGRELSHVEDRVTGVVRDRPVQSLGAALAIGFLLALILRR